MELGVMIGVEPNVEANREIVGRSRGMSLRLRLSDMGACLCGLGGLFRFLLFGIPFICFKALLNILLELPMLFGQFRLQSRISERYGRSLGFNNVLLRL